jgi:WD40 repeat protein
LPWPTAKSLTTRGKTKSSVARGDHGVGAGARDGGGLVPRPDSTGQLVATLVGHTQKINSLEFMHPLPSSASAAADSAAAGPVLFSSSDDGTIRAWDPVAGTQLATVTGSRMPISCLRMRWEGSLLASSSGFVREVPLRDLAAALARSGRAASAGPYSYATAPAVLEWARCRTLRSAHMQRITALAGDSEFMASCAKDGSILLRSTRTSEVIHLLTYTDELLLAAAQRGEDPADPGAPPPDRSPRSMAWGFTTLAIGHGNGMIALYSTTSSKHQA